MTLSSVMEYRFYKRLIGRVLVRSLEPDAGDRSGFGNALTTCDSRICARENGH